jgi:hypothetical protein
VSKLFNDQGGMEKVKALLGVAKAKMPEPVLSAHRHCSNHRAEVMSSSKCGCFYCEKTFQPAEIVEWVDDGKTAVCPKCGIDSVIGSASGFPLTQAFLNEMNGYWF